MKLARQQLLAAVAVQLYPGLSSRELSTRSGLARGVLSRRLPELERERVVLREPQIVGRDTWHPLTDLETLTRGH